MAWPMPARDDRSLRGRSGDELSELRRVGSLVHTGQHDEIGSGQSGEGLPQSSRRQRPQTLARGGPIDQHDVEGALQAKVLEAIVQDVDLRTQPRLGSPTGGVAVLPHHHDHTLELLGGWPGGLVAMRAFRHKTQKRSYRLVFFGIVLLHAAAWGIYAKLALA